jgi:hypothetical protein
MRTRPLFSDVWNQCDTSDELNDPPKFPLYVRVLAVAHVLSLAIGPIGFVVLGAIAVIHWQRQRVVDQYVVVLLLIAVNCPFLCAAYRRWFENWGRKNWPDGKPNEHDW